MAGRIPMSFRAEGARVLLRAPRREDALRVLDVQRHSWDFLGPWMPALESGRDASEEMRERLHTDRVQWADDRSYRFLVCDRETGAIMGRVSLNNVVRGVMQGVDIGYWIAGSHARRGLMSEAVRVALGVAFGPLGLHRVQAGIIPRNAASIALARKVGFREEGLARRFLKIAGAWEDHVLFAITAEEWPALAGARGSRRRKISR